jgi:hypothetical protein
MPYLLDANVFIQAKQLYYGMDFCPAFWDWLIQQNAQGTVHSIEKVGDELTAGNDALSKWASDRDATFFLPPDEKVLQALTTVSNWVKSQQYHPHAVNSFLQDADYYLVAHALAHKYTIVTHEVAGDRVKRVKIPEVCIGVKVKAMSPYQMLRVERARFVLGNSDRGVA